MTGRETPSPDAVLHLLDEAGIAEDPALVRAVETIGALKAGPAPEVSAELAQLMADGGKAPSGRRHKRRITFIGGALAVSMGVGMSGVAAGTALTDGLTEAVESVARFSIRDSADRAEPLPDALAGPHDGGDPGVVAPSADARGRSLVEPVPAPSAAGEADRAVDAGLPAASPDSSVTRTAPDGHDDAAPVAQVDAASGGAQAGRAAAVPPAAGSPAAVPPARPAPAAAAPPAAVPPAAVSPVAPTGSASTPGPERRAVPGAGRPAPGNAGPERPVPGGHTPGAPVPGNGAAGGQGHGIYPLKEARGEAPVGPEADPRGKGASSVDARATPEPPGRAWLLAPAGGPGQVPSAPVTGDPDRLFPGGPGSVEATFAPAPVPVSGRPVEVAGAGDVPPSAPTPGSSAGPVEELPAVGSAVADAEQSAPGQPPADVPAADVPVPGLHEGNGSVGGSDPR